MSDKGSAYNAKDDVEKAFGVIYTACMVFGTPANFLSFLYFLRRKTGAATNKTYMTYLYRMIAFIDILICFLIFPLIESSFLAYNEKSGKQGRNDFSHTKQLSKKMANFSSSNKLQGESSKYQDEPTPVLFGDPTFCIIWGLLWNILPVLSVFLVAILSFSRCLLLLYPLKKLDIRKPAIFLVVVTLLMVIEKLVAHFSSIENVYDDVEYMYLRKFVIACYLSSQKTYAAESKYDSAQSFLFLILLGLPVIPILGSLIVSVYKLKVAEKNETRLKSVNEKSKHHEATVTVLIGTGIYIICNVPVLICHLRYAIFLIGGIQSLRRHKSLDRDWSEMIIWNLISSASYTLLVAINSSLNPIVYFTRMKEFRDSVIKQKKNIMIILRKHGSTKNQVVQVNQQVLETDNDLSGDANEDQTIEFQL